METLSCGSGVVAAWLARERPALRVAETDRSAAAAESARLTAEANAVADRVPVTQADGLELLPDSSEPLVVLNPPFHSDAALHTGIAGHLFAEAGRVLSPGGEPGRLASGLQYGYVFVGIELVVA